MLPSPTIFTIILIENSARLERSGVRAVVSRRAGSDFFLKFEDNRQCKTLSSVAGMKIGDAEVPKV